MGILVALSLICSVSLAVLSLHTAEGLYHKNHNIGRFDITEYANENVNSDDPYELKGLLCSRITYKSPNVFFSYTDENMLRNANLKLSLLIDWSETFYAFVSVNRFGKPSHLDVTGNIREFIVVNEHMSVGLEICAYHEPLGKDRTDATYAVYPSISADWLVLLNGLSSSSTSDASILRLTNIYENGYRCYYHSEPNKHFLSAVIAKFTVENDSDLDRRAVLWLDSLYTGQRGFVANSAMVCLGIPHVEKIVTNSTVSVSVLFLYNNASVNSGLPSDVQSYRSEYGYALMYPEIDQGLGLWRSVCLDKKFKETYTAAPYVFVTASFREKSSISKPFEKPVTAWVEFINDLGFRVCVARPNFVALGLEFSHVPSVEYLIISLDGIYDAATEEAKSDKLAITLEMSFPGSVERFLRQLENVNVNSIIKHITPRALMHFLNYGYLVHPDFPNKFYHYLYYLHNGESDEFLKEHIVDPIRTYFSKGVFPYNDNDDLSKEALKYRDALYPDGPPDLNEEVSVSVYFDNGCIYGSFDDGECSIDECGTNGGGLKVIQRRLNLTFGAKRCPPSTLIVSCNTRPCAFENNASIIVEKNDSGDHSGIENNVRVSGGGSGIDNVSDSGCYNVGGGGCYNNDGEAREPEGSGSVNLTLLWVVIGVVAVAGAGAAGGLVYLYKRYNLSSLRDLLLKK